jgi:hypothetical protein
LAAFGGVAGAESVSPDIRFCREIPTRVLPGNTDR